MRPDDLLRLLVIMAAALFGLVGIRQDAGPVPPPMVPTPTPADAVVQQEVDIQSADVMVLKTFPAQLQLRVRGIIPDGCNFPVVAEVQRDGMTITVRIYREVQIAAMCPAMAGMYEDTIPLGSYASGEYTIRVNYAPEIRVTF